ncbi:MAG: DUF456 domain-containing protein [Verrucomicrobiales bacterium]|nr:DUF456 domain-containing protein [Verrucomicrobiales bacterium]
MMDWLTQLWQQIVSGLQSVEWSSWGAWTLTLTLLTLGALGTVVPFLPGPLLIFFAAVVHTLLRPQSGLSAAGLILLGLLVVAAYFIDGASGAMGARWFGASRWGMLGVVVGGLVGLFFSLPGILLGPLIGGFAFEMLFAKKSLKPAARSTWGTVVGTGVGMVARVVIACVMLGVFFIDALWW